MFPEAFERSGATLFFNDILALGFLGFRGATKSKES
jgi:hypothetical protein